MPAKSIYIHLPFCKTKCPYCDFASFVEDETSKQQAYIDALNREIDLRLRDYDFESDLIETIFFGGGTPSIHNQKQLRQILDKLQQYFRFNKNVEVTLEANPGTIDLNKLIEFREIGINRISIGVQTFDEKLLQKLGRGHSVQDSFKVIEDIKNAGYNSWSFDLIYGLPQQDLESWNKTLDISLDLATPHISAYALSIEERTPFGAIYKNSYHQDLPNEDLVIEMYSLANEKFENTGLLRYEISNWAKANFEAKHNLTYWQAEEYFAFGLSAHGYIDRTRYKNVRELKNYMDFFLDSESMNKKVLTEQKYNLAFSEENFIIDNREKLEEQILLGLRLTKGLVLDQDTLKLINEDSLKKYLNQGFLEIIENNLRLTNKALMVSNKIIGALLA